MKKNKDVKFIIYQALYIFVICVIFIKGADLTLEDVINKKHGWAYVDTTNKVLIDKNELANLIHFDSTKYLIVLKEDYKNNPEKYVNNPLVIAGNLNPENDNTNKVVENKITDPNQKADIKPEIVLGEITLYQYHDNTVNNKSDVPINVKGVIIPAHTTGTVRIDGDNSVIISAGKDNSKTQSTIPNKKPQINFSKMATMNEETKVSQLQRTVGFRVTISDDFANQLDFKITGGVTYKVVKQSEREIVIDIMMNAFGSKAAFDNFTDNKQNTPYSTGFTVTVRDKIAPHSVTGQQSFVFGEW